MPGGGHGDTVSELELTEDPADKRRWTLDGVGELHWAKGMFKNGEASLTAGPTTWTLKRSSLSAKAEALDATGSEAARFEPKGAFSRGGEIITPRGTWALRPASRWKNRYALADGDTELATVETDGWAHRRVTVELADETVPAELLLLACWLVRGFAEESAAATATTFT